MNRLRPALYTGRDVHLTWTSGTPSSVGNLGLSTRSRIQIGKVLFLSPFRDGGEMKGEERVEFGEGVGERFRTLRKFI